MGIRLQKLLSRLPAGFWFIKLPAFAGMHLLISAITLCLFEGFPTLAARPRHDLPQFYARANPYEKLKPQLSVETDTASQYALAAKAFAEAEELRARWEEVAFREAVEKYEEAAISWRRIAPGQAAKALRSAGDVFVILSDHQQALSYYQRALKISRQANSQVEELEALNGIGYAYIYLGESQKALSYITTANKRAQRLPPSVDNSIKRDLEARTLNSMGEAYYAQGDLKTSLKMYTKALGIWTEANDRLGLALAHLNLGYSYTDIGDLQEATQHYRQSLALWNEIGNRRGEALARTALGGIYSFLGDNQLALDSHTDALALFRAVGNYQGAAAAINGIAQAYENLSEYKMALENYQSALALYEAINNRDFVALNKYYIGRVYFSMGERAQARAFYLEALSLSRAVHDRQIEAHVLKGLGIIDSVEGNNTGALKQFMKVLNLYDVIGYRRGKAYALNSIGHVYYTLGDRRRALDCFQRALPIMRATEDRRGEALTRYNLARVEYALENLDAALLHIKESVSIIEASRTKIDSKDLRTSYFAQAYKHYELYIDLLMQMHKRGASTDYAAAAFLASERARARSLLDMLTEEKVNPHQGALGGLLLREQELMQRLNAKTEYKTRLLSGNHTAAEADEVAEEISTLSREYEAVQAQIRGKNPRYAAITQPSHVRIEDIQAELRDGNTLLLEFSLGNERSYLWVVSPTSVSAYELPGRAVIESTVDKVYDSLTARQRLYEGKAPQNREFIESSDLDYQRETAALSWTLLGQVAAQLGSKRLLIVADGALHYVPFEALPVPQPPAAANLAGGAQVNQPEPRLLIDDHEIVELPSALILAAIRKDIKQPATDLKTVAVLADPVFDKDDPRLHHAAKQEDSATQLRRIDDAYLHRALRTLNREDNTSAIPRLPASLREARAIMSVIPSSKGMMAVGFDATRERVMSEELKHYRIIHFATHGILDNEQPEMSGLIFSLFDNNGNSQSGYLRLKDIYGLDMRADLVVLSACRTGLGRSVQGEGLVGLTQGFMYAGSKGVVASLWKVDDEATAELMKNFYASMLKDGLSPAAALRAAKQALRAKKQWRSPYFWAAFVLQGEYRETFATPQAEKSGRFVAPLVAVLLGLPATVLFLLWIRRKRSARNETAQSTL